VEGSLAGGSPVAGILVEGILVEDSLVEGSLVVAVDIPSADLDGIHCCLAVVPVAAGSRLLGEPGDRSAGRRREVRRACSTC